MVEGNGGLLRGGLPWQSVHDGQRFVHEPVRLNVFIAAPIEAMNTVIAKHPSVRELVDNHWLHLFALDERGQVSHHYCGGLEWSEGSEFHPPFRAHRAPLLSANHGMSR